MRQSYKDLVAWTKAMKLVTEVYRLTQGFPKEEVYGLTSQIHGVAVSVPSNIAEGQRRLTEGEFQQILGQAGGSLMEVETQILVDLNLEYLDRSQAAKLLSKSAEAGRVLNGLLAAMRP